MADEPKIDIRSEGIAPRQPSMRLGWTIREELPTNNNIYDYSGRHEEVDEANKYRHGQGVRYEPPTGSRCWASVEVLPLLKGRPWNNLALAAVHALRPSYVRVRGPNEGATCDCITWRVTVLLEQDDRTIRKITQEVEVSGLGLKTGQDFLAKLAGEPLPPPSDDPHVYVNGEALKRLDVRE